MPDFKEPKRFWDKVDVGEVDDCWEWQACKTKGYGQFGINYKMYRAPRVAWTLTYGPIPEGLQVCHRCDNRGCCNPYHLFLGTNQDNHVDAAQKGRKARGEGNGRSRLTEEDVLEIRKRYGANEITQRDLARELGVSDETISEIVNRKTWDWLL